MTKQDIHHKLRNLMNNIAMNAELAKLQISQQAPAEKILVSLEKVTESCRSCAEVLDSEPHDHG
ncbi:hypothetical protein ACCI51_08910 [Microbulbifer echini]|uniref:Histidine kinase n=1 Tax=Microbulbifer echini TaxID=1529067 RepID=A0ABV4NM89_9GAMM|nr:hypothetical protein [uncultured Microbulbifer sp.]